jgi:hypothetical protein
LINKPKQLTNRSDARRWDVTVASAYRAEYLCLFFASHEECDAPAALDRRIGHGDTDLGPAM